MNLCTKENNPNRIQIYLYLIYLLINFLEMFVVTKSH